MERYRGDRCLTDAEIAAYAKGGIETRNLMAVREHLHVCQQQPTCWQRYLTYVGQQVEEKTG